ncbi:MAG: SLBB domain-containing protein [Candidatus Riflebacteria bacterium]|nr:SLBB domain-containing protein [Candidatus Riflebacteria bacterium]
MKRWLLLLCIGLIVFISPLSAQSVTSAAPLPFQSPVIAEAPVKAAPMSSGSKLRSEDIIHLRVYNNRGGSEIDQDLTINESGDLDVPLVGFVHVGGHKLTELHDILNKALTESAFKGPRVQVSMVKLATTDRVFIWGGVRNPGTLEIRDHITLMDAIKQAGGFYDDILNGTAGYGTNYYDRSSNISTYMMTQSLDYLDETKLKRDGKEIAIKLKRLIRDADMSQNVELRADDVLIIPTRANISPKNDETVYVLGAVLQPARYRFRQNMSVLDAIYMAGGLTNPHQIRFASIIRGIKEPQAAQNGKPIPGGSKAGGATPEIIRVDLRSLFYRGDIQNDQRLQGGDLLLVSTREYRNFLSTFGKFIDNFLPIFGRATQVVGYDTTIRAFNDRFILNK